MRLPDSIKVGDFIYRITEESKQLMDARGLWGECQYMQQEIFINASLNDERKKLVFCHEMVHAMLHEHGRDDYNDEEFIKQLGVMIYRLLRDNDFSFMKRSGLASVGVPKSASPSRQEIDR